MRRTLLLVVVLLLLPSACLPRVELAPTRTAPGDLPAGTQALPPAFTPTPSPPPTLTPVPTLALPALEQRLGLLPDFAGDVEALEGATQYWIEVNIEFDPRQQGAVLDGRARIHYVNRTEARLEDIVLMLWPNTPQYAASMLVGPAVLQGEVIEGEPIPDSPGLRFALPRAIDPGDPLDLSLPFRVEVGSMTGLRRMAVSQGMLLAPTFYPLVPRWVDGDWESRDAPPGGDTTNSDIAFYQLDLTWPAAYELVASGVALNRRVEGDTQSATYVSGPMRDVALAVGPFIQETRRVGEVDLVAWVLPDHQDDLETILDAAEVQMTILGEWVGAYPYKELDLVDAPGAFGGIEYPGLVYLGTLGSHWVVEPTVHEVAHQWFYGLIGDDQIEQPWLDEGAATYAEALYYEAAQGTGRGTGFLSELRTIVRQTPDTELPIGWAIDEYPSESAYAVQVYFKGALFFDALRNELGEERFRSFLQAYYQAYRYQFADSLGFQQIAEETCRCDLDPLFDLWVYEGGSILELE